MDTIALAAALRAAADALLGTDPTPATPAWPEGIQGEDPAVLEALANKPEPIDIPLYYGVPVVETSEPIREPIVGDFSDELWQGYADMGEVPVVDIAPLSHDAIVGLDCPFCNGTEAA